MVVVGGGGSLARALGMMPRMALGRALARPHMHGPSASTAQPGTSKPNPKLNPNTRLWTC